MSGIHHSLWSLKDEYTDVVIIINNGKCQIGAHKIILSAASDFFRKLLKEENESILLPDVSRQEMNFILELIYRGRTYLEAKHYQRCLDISELLELTILKDPIEANLKANTNDNDSAVFRGEDTKFDQTDTFTNETVKENPAPSSGGVACPGSSTENAPCNGQQCPIGKTYQKCSLLFKFIFWLISKKKT